MEQQPDRTPVKLTRRQNLLQLLKFTLFSISAGMVQLLSFTLITELVPNVPYWPAYLTALTLSVVYNFTVNRKFTFKSAKNVPLAMLQVLGYYLVFTPLSTWWGDALSNAGWNSYIVLLGTMVINFVTEFLFCRFVVYRRDMFTNEDGRRELESLCEDGGDTAASADAKQESPAE